MKKLVCLSFFILGLTHCSSQTLESAPAEQRSAKSKARDMYRHPVETLKFFDVQPNMTVVEISPGSGWYTEILAPHLKGGELYLAIFEENSPRKYFRDANKKLKDMLQANGKNIAKIHFRTFKHKNGIGPIAPANSVDRVLTFRNVHNWMKAGEAKQAFAEFFRVLKQGGVLGVVEHREKASRKQDTKALSGYVKESVVIKIAESVGFKFVAKSEINANSKDNAKHPKGVWTLPPSLKLGDKDKAKYLSIGESDRMTMKFVKP